MVVEVFVGIDAKFPTVGLVVETGYPCPEDVAFLVLIVRAYLRRIGTAGNKRPEIIFQFGAIVDCIYLSVSGRVISCASKDRSHLKAQLQ